MSNPLQHLRARLDAVDRQIVEALAERQRLIGEVAASKLERSDSAIRDLGREEALLTRIVALAEQQGADPILLTQLYQQILQASVRWQQQRVVDRDNPNRPRIVAYQGRAGSYSHAAAVHFFAVAQEEVTLVGHSSFRSLLDAVAEERADIALLPIENTTAGSIDEALDLLGRSGLAIVGEEIQRVDHCLVGAASVPLESIRQVFSHPQALRQCTQFLAQHPTMRREPWTDTASSVAHIASLGDPTAAAIASAEAAALYGLPILTRGIADQTENYTRMVLVSREQIQVDHRIPCKTSAFFATRRLVECLHALDRHGLTVSTLVARPRPHQPWQYRYYCDFEGNLGEAETRAAVDELASHTDWLRILGSYPSRTGAPHRHATPRPESPLEAARSPLDVVRLGDWAIGTAPIVITAITGRSEANAAWKAGAGAVLGTYPDPGLEAARTAGLAVVESVTKASDVSSAAERADGLWLGPDAADNPELLKAASLVDRPLFLVRPSGTSREAWLSLSQELEAGGNRQVILVHAGGHGIDGRSLDVVDLAALRQLCAKPMLLDIRRLAPVGPDLVAAAAAVGIAGTVVGSADAVAHARLGLDNRS